MTVKGKQIKVFSILALASFLMMSMNSCQKEKEYRSSTGKPVVFCAGTVGSAVSKAEYLGHTAGETVEKINWEEGDIITIACAQTAEKSEDYRIEEGDRSMSAVEPVNQGLHWGSGSHTFYAVYPGAAEALTEGGILTGVTAAAQTPVSVSEVAPYFAKADLTNEYMAAVTPGVEPYSEDVSLSFIPFTTAIQFTITNDYPEYPEEKGKEILDIESVSLISEGHKLSGTFTANLASWEYGYPKCVLVEGKGESDRVTIDLDNLQLKRGETLEFTLFLMPSAGHYSAAAKENVIDDLYFRINKGGDEGWIQTKLAYKDMTGIAFPCHKKSYVTGLLVPEGAIWTVRFAPEIGPWGSGINPNVNPEPEIHPEPIVTAWTSGGGRKQEMLKYNYTLDVEGNVEFGHAGIAESIFRIISTREKDHAYVPVMWHLEYWDKTANEWKPAKSQVMIDNLVTLNPVVGSGAGVNIELPGPAEIKMKVEAATSVETKSHNSRLQGATAKGSASVPYDLSTHDIYGNARPAGKPVCANCYVINAPGWYAIPLVYGNAIDNNAAPAGGINVPAYNPGAESAPTTKYLTQFVNSNGRRILTPYIEEDPSDITEPEAGDEGWKAEVVWNDHQSKIHVDNISVYGKDNSLSNEMTSYECGYIVFHVQETDLTQGNFVIGLKHNGQIMWSWHIWVTDNSLKSVRVSNSSPVSMLPFNLGWVDNDCENPFNSYDGASVKLRAVQTGSGVTKEFTVVRRTEDDAPHSFGSSLFWQWGRKDPFTSSPASSTGVSEVTDIAYSIKNPKSFIYSTSGKYQWYKEKAYSETEDKEAMYRNLWSATNQNVGGSAIGFNSKPLKTIYDPCPPGFQVPQADAFSEHAFPDTGYLSNNGTFSSVGGYYWNAVPSTDDASYYTGSGTGAGYSAYRANGYSVRPVQQ